MKKLVIIDGNALLHRAYHAIAPLSDPKGRLVNAVYGFARVFQKAMKDLEPDYVAVCWDRREKTFRHEAYAGYKAQRAKHPQELYDQIKMIQDFLSAYGVPSYDAAGFEADDLIATIAVKSKTDKVIILTGDKDTLQLVDDKINILAFKKGVSETLLYTPEEIKNAYGLEPKQMIDLKALAGDPSDNIKGVYGIGKTGAEKLLKQYGGIENLYKQLEKGKLEATEKVKGALERGKKDAYASRDLVILEKDAPIKFSLEEMRFGDYDKEAVKEFFIEYGFRSLLDGDKGQGTAAVRELASLNLIKDIIRDIEENGELLFYVEEGKEGLFGKEAQAFYFGCGGKFYKILFSQKLKAKDVFAAFAKVFENEKIKKSGYDLKRQMYILDNFGIKLAGVYFDILIAGYILNPGERRYEIDGLVLDFLKKQMSKDLIMDLAMLKELFAKRLEEEKLGKVFFEIEMPLCPVLFRMEKNGIKVNREKLAGLSADFEKRLQKIDKEIWRLAGGEFNIDSPQQLKIVLYDKLGLKPASGRIKRGKTGLSTAASELEKLSGTHEIIDLISEHRELAKLKNTYIDALPKLLDKQARVHSSFNQTVTSTGRLSSSAPNLQNIPIKTELGRQIREAFVADKGSVLISLDYSQIELRLAAALSGEEHMIRAFDRGEDIHKQTAAEIFGIPLAEVTKEKRQRAKTINFGVLYGMGINGLAAATKMSRVEAEDFLNRYYAAHPAIMEYIERTKALAYKTGYVETIFGRRRYLPDIRSRIDSLRAAAERMAINMPIQGTAADIIKLAMIEIDKNISSPDIKMVLQVHDELVFEVKKSMSEKAAKEIQEVMENIYKLTVPLVVEAEIGERWE